MAQSTSALQVELYGVGYYVSKQSLSIARNTEGTRVLADVGIETTTMMLRTRHWRAVDPLLFDVEKLAQPGTLRWAILKHLQGNFLMRACRYDGARDPLAGAYEAARSVGNRRLESIVLRDLAIVLHRGGSVTKGIEFMRHAVELAEGTPACGLCGIPMKPQRVCYPTSESND